MVMTLALFIVFCTAALVGYSVIPMTYNKAIVFNQKRAHRFARKLDRMMPRQQVTKITQFYMLAPLALGGLAYALAPEGMRLTAVAMGVAGGFFFPAVYTKTLVFKNRRKFENQLIDALMIMSSSFRGGLSLIQAMEAVTEEMPPPIQNEFMTVLGENKMGVSLEEALNHLYNRMPSPALQQMITAILLARETGGNLPVIFSRIVHVIRERKRIIGQIETLSIQGKIQGIVMSMLPLGFFSIVYSTNPHFFDSLFLTDIGRVMLIYAAVSWLVGAYLVWKISSFKEF